VHLLDQLGQLQPGELADAVEPLEREIARREQAFDARFAQREVLRDVRICDAAPAQRALQLGDDLGFVTEIVTIPDYYLRNSKGFEGLQGVQRLYSVDIMALVSYDQVEHRDENDWSLGYITIVGAYVLKGSHHDVATLVDLAVVDPVTQSLILRAGGTDSRARNSTLVDQPRAAREASAASFATATTQMIDNFDVALTKFEADVRAGKANIRVAKREGGGRSGGGGSFAPLSLGLLALLAIARRRAMQRVG
jgi:rhombotail lipoprotein